MSDIILSPSPNHNERPAGKAIDILLIHYTGMRDGDAALQRLRDPAAKVSSHYLIEEDGRIHRLVDESRRAWHAGVGYWAGERDINAVSIGIELVNPGHDNGYRAFPQPQMAALIELGKAILARHPIPPSRVLGHSDIAPTRKIDPGELFDWKALAAAGIGLWPAPAIRTLRTWRRSSGRSDATAMRSPPAAPSMRRPPPHSRPSSATSARR